LIVAAHLQASKARFTSTLNTARFIAVNAVRFYIQWSYSKEALYWLPKGWVPYPVEWLLSFPRAPLGSVSVQAWQMACGAMLALVGDGVGALIVLFFNPPKKASTKSQANVKISVNASGGKKAQ
jgi:hypothetical protein